jgi:hypothetical protein
MLPPLWGVGTHRVEQVVLDQAEHLVGLVDFDRRVREAEVPPQRGHDACVDAGDGRAAEVHGGGAGLVVDGAADFFPGCHLHKKHMPAGRAAAGRFGRRVFMVSKNRIRKGAEWRIAGHAPKRNGLRQCRVHFPR